MTTVEISKFNCIECGLPNGEAITKPDLPCVHCRVRPRRADKSVRDPSAGEGEERSFWRFLGRGKRPSRVKV